MEYKTYSVICEGNILAKRMELETVRARSVKVIREVPLEECGLLGKILAKEEK